MADRELARRGAQGSEICTTVTWSKVLVLPPSRPAPAPVSPPLIAIEILSTDDRLTAVREKLQEYRTWGVGHVWLVDPHSQRLYTCDTGLTEVKSLVAHELGIELTPDQIFE